MNDPLLKQLELKAESLRNGHKGDLATISEVLADLTHLMCYIASNGCQRANEHQRFTWPACAAYISTLLAIVGIVAKLT